MDDDTVALGVKGYDPQDAIAPLQAYLAAQQGRNLGAEATSRDIANQQNQLALASRQNLAGSLKTPGVNQLSALNASGLGAYDPAAAQTVLGNFQAENTLGAYSNYKQDPTNPSTLAPAGPVAVGDATNALARAQEIAKSRQDQIGQLALGFLNSDRSEGARQTTLDMAHDSSMFHDPVTGRFNQLLYHNFQTMPLAEFTERARQLAASGTGSVVNSGQAEGNVDAARFPYEHFSAPATDQVYGGPAWREGPPPPGGYADPRPTVSQQAAPGAPGMGRSAATGGAAQIAQMAAQADQAHGLPTNFTGGTIGQESRGNPLARNASGAMGLMQIMPDTWKQYARPGQNPYNPADSIDVASRLAVDNQRVLTNELGRPPTASELYLAHQQGAGGAAALLKNPNAPAASIIGAKALISNGGTPSMTAGAFSAMWENKFTRGGGGNFGLSGPNPTGPGVAMPDAPAPAAEMPGAGVGVGLRAAAGAAPPAPAQPDLAPPVASPIPLPSSTQPMPTLADASGRSAAAPVPPTAPLTSANPNAPVTLQRGMTPFQFRKQELDAQRAVDEERSARDQFQAANTAQSGLMQLSEDLTKLDPSKMSNLRDTFLSEGAGAETRIGLAKTVNGVLTSAGMAPLFDQDKIAAAESAAKTTGRLGFGDTVTLGRGEAASIVHQAIGLNPSIVNTPSGQKLLIGSLLAAQQRQKDFYLYQRQYSADNGGNPIGAETLFDESRSPMSYVQDAQRISRVPLQAVKMLQQYGHSQAAIDTFNKTYGPGLARYYLGSRTY